MKSSTLTALAVAYLLSALSYAQLAAAEREDTAPPKFDVLIFAPHPDDEVLGCSGVILQAIAAGKRVGVVVFTNGDGYPKAAAVITKRPLEELTPRDFVALAAERQRQSVEGLKRLGLPAGSLFFLGYPDSELANLYRAEDEQTIRQQFTGRDHTYGPVVADFHAQSHGKPAPYTRSSVLADVRELLEAHEPDEIYVTHELDSHADHEAAYRFVRTAADTAGFRGKLYTYIVHGDDRPDSPPHTVTLTPDQVKTKRHAIEAHQIPTIHDHLVTYAQAEEHFWPIAIDHSAN